MTAPLIALALLLALAGWLEPLAQEAGSSAGAGSRWAASHFRVRDPARLTEEHAARTYLGIRDEMIAMYRLSRDPNAEAYARWPVYVSAPYQTAAHGDRYHNIYARSSERRYGRFEQAGEMAPGTVVAKDSFSVSADGKVYPGPLSIMEKLPAGASPETGDWRFTEIMPDGSVYGATGGPLAGNVAHCVGCHRVVAVTQDWLYFPPLSHRASGAP
jgi:hypothetical protein